MHIYKATGSKFETPSSNINLAIYPVRSAMGRGSDKKKEEKKAAAEKKGSSKKGAIPKYAHFAKASLAPYPDEDGAPLWLGDKEGLQELLALSNIMASRSPKNSEMLARPGMAISLAAAAVHHGGRDLLKKKLDKSGEKVAKVLQTDAGKTFLEACAVLNLGKEGTAPREDVKEAVHQYVKFFTKQSEKELAPALAEMVGVAGRCYLMCMHLLEQHAFFSKLGGWAKKWGRADQQPAAMKSWLKEPSKVSKLEEGIVSLVMEKIAGHKSRAKNKGSRSNSEASGGSSSKSEAASNGSSSSEKSKEKRKKKTKKDDKEKKEKKHKKKEKRSPAKKKDKKRRSSSESAGTRKSKSRKGSSSEAPEKPQGLAFGTEDEETSVAGDSLPEALKNWSAEEACALAKEVEGAMKNIEDKSKRHNLAAIIAMLDNLPEEVLAFANLTEALSTLKGMSRLPRKDKVGALLTQLQSLAAKRIVDEILEDDAPERREPAMPTTATIHRVGGVTAEGKAAVKEGDPVDTVEIASGDSVEDVVQKLFKAQGSAEDRGNWKVKALDEDHVLRDVSAETTPASACPNIALLRKGG